MSEENELKVKPVPVDLDDLHLEDDNLEGFNPEADASEGFAPPPDGLHRVKVRLNKNQNPTGFISGRDKNGRSYIIADIETEIVAPGEDKDKQRMFDSASTMVLRNGASGMGTILSKLGRPAPAGVTKIELAKALAEALAGEPELGVESQWQARGEDENGEYKTVKRGMKRFPKNPDGTPSHVFVKDGDRYTAQAKIIRYLSIEELEAALAA